MPRPPDRPLHSDDTEPLTLEQTAHRLTISKRSLERLIAAGDFPRPIKIGRSSRVFREDVSGYLEQLRRKRGDKIGSS